MAQLTLATCHAKEKAPGLMHKTRRELFLERREALIPWKGLEATMSPHDHPQGQQGRPLYDLAVTLRVPCMKLFDNLSHPTMEDALYEIESLARPCRASLLLNPRCNHHSRLPPPSGAS